MQKSSEFKLLQDNLQLRPFQSYYVNIRDLIHKRLAEFQNQKGLDYVSQSYKRYGLHRDGNKYIYRQWAPAVKSISIFGDFNGWKRGEYQCQKSNDGLWTCQIDAKIPEFSAVKVQVQLQNKCFVDRIPAWINFTRQNQDTSFDGVYVELGGYKWKSAKPEWSNEGLTIYECHVGMAGVDQKVHSFNHFRENILPRIKKLGYKALQMMGIIEHPYYGSFGYHISSFFSVSSRFGTPNQFKQLVDAAHALGIKVVIDLVHSHATKNVNEGLNMWDGSDCQYFLEGEKGDHPMWDSKVFNYSKFEVLRFLLSNIRFWLQEYQCDGFRFDGISSMLYHHHGVHKFSGDCSQYFNEYLNVDAVCYLSLANQLAKTVDPNAILIAQDWSGYPGLVRPLEEGGIGFTYRLALAAADMWIRMLKESKDEDWFIGIISATLTNTRRGEPTIAYVECHDQAIVGDITLIQQLLGQEIYQCMSLQQKQSYKVFRAMALHKMIKLVNFSLGSKAYLNFMGNEFGHPEWIDFPRLGNNWSYQYCRRRWDLADRTDLRFRQIAFFDHKMLELNNKYHILSSEYEHVRKVSQPDKIMIYQRGPLLFVFNWNPTKSFENYWIECRAASKAVVVLSTEEKESGGHCRVNQQIYPIDEVNHLIGKFQMQIPSRCAIVFHLLPK